MDETQDPIRVLIVEDEPLVAKAMIRRLKTDGFDMAHVKSINDARPLLATFPFDVVLLDLSLPDSSGVATVQRMREITQAPIVVCTGACIGPDDKLAIEVISAGADFYIEKTADISQVRRSIRLAIEIEKRRLADQGDDDYAIEDVCGRLLQIEQAGALICYCQHCDKVVCFVESNLGPLVCPHCSQRMLLEWGIAEFKFRPELPPALWRSGLIAALNTMSRRLGHQQLGSGQNRQLVAGDDEKSDE